MAGGRALGLLVIWLIASCGAPSDTPAAVPSGAPNDAPAVPSGAPTPVFNATAEGDGNSLKISAAGDPVVVEVQSQSGIGAGSVELVSGAPPANIVVRLHLRGLEQLRLSYEQTVITAAVSSGDSNSIDQSVALPDGSAHPIAAGSPLWLDIRIISAQQPPAIPLQQGYFEVRLPPGLLHEQRRSFALRWIDFYR